MLRVIFVAALLVAMVLSQQDIDVMQDRLLVLFQQEVDVWVPLPKSLDFFHSERMEGRRPLRIHELIGVTFDAWREGYPKIKRHNESWHNFAKRNRHFRVESVKIWDKDGKEVVDGKEYKVFFINGSSAPTGNPQEQLDQRHTITELAQRR